MEHESYPLPVVFDELQLPPTCLSPTSLELPVGISITAWCHLWSPLQQFQSAGTWFLADWICYGKDMFGEEAEQGLDQVPAVTIRQLEWVARRIPPARRRATLSWSHHREVAGLDPTQADLLLDAAERENWSVQRLKEAITEQDGRQVHRRADKGAAIKYSESKIGKLWTEGDHASLCLYLGVGDGTSSAKA